MARSYWLVKSEPFKYSWDDFVKDGSTYWDGVRNAQARNNLRAMKKGDLALYYHSNEGKEVVGIVEIVRESYPDPTSDDERWVVVDVEPRVRLVEVVKGDIGVVREVAQQRTMHARSFERRMCEKNQNSGHHLTPRSRAGLGLPR